MTASRPFPLSRRQVLAVVGAVPVVGALAAGGRVWTWWKRPAGEGRKVLSDDEHAFVQALGEAMFPPGGEPALSGREANLGAFFDDMLAAMEPAQANEMRLLLHALDDITLPTHLRTFKNLALDVRTALIGGWLHADVYLLRSGAQALLVLLAEGYAMHPEVAPIFAAYHKCGYGR